MSHILGAYGGWFSFASIALVGSAALALAVWLSTKLVRDAGAQLVHWRAAIVLIGVFVFAEAGGIPDLLLDQLLYRGVIGDGSSLNARELGDRAPLPEPATDGTALSVWPFVVWCLGFGLLSFRMVNAMIALRRLRTHVRQVESDELRRRVAEVACRIGYVNPVHIGLSATLQSPLVFGVWYPTLVLPADFEKSFSPEQQEAILAHEIGHFANRDPLWNWLIGFVSALLWWNPLVWMVRRRHVDASEIAADEVSLQIEHGPFLLAEGLVILGQRLAPPGLDGSMGAGGLRSRLAWRVMHLLSLEKSNDGRSRSWRGSLWATGLLALGASLAFTSAILAHSSWTPSTGGVAQSILLRFVVTPSARGDSDAMNDDPIVKGTTAVPATKQVEAAKAAPPKKRSDAEIVGKLGLSQTQLDAFVKLQAELEADNRALKNLKTGHLERGLEINKKWHAGLRRVFTDEQYERYLDYWHGPAPRRALPVGATRVLKK